MKCFVAVIFLVAVAVADHNDCTPHGNFSARVIAASNGEPYLVTGEIMADIPGERIWMKGRYKKGVEAEVLILLKKNTLYITSEDGCHKRNLRGGERKIINFLDLPKDWYLWLQSGDIADSNVQVNFYGGSFDVAGHQVSYIVSRTVGSCVLTSASFYSGKDVHLSYNLLDVKMGIDEEKFKPPKDCKK